MKTIKELLIDYEDTVADDYYYCLSELNLLANTTPEELDMSAEQMQSSIEKNRRSVESLAAYRSELHNWIEKIGSGSGEEFRDELFEHIPELKRRFERLNNT